MSILVARLLTIGGSLLLTQRVADDRMCQINEDTYAIIQPGMTQRQVVGILGQLPSEYPSTRGVIADRILTFRTLNRDAEIKNGTGKVWLGREVAIVVFFDNKGIVKGKEIEEVLINKNLIELIMNRIPGQRKEHCKGLK